MGRRGELALIQRAIRQGWDITDKGRDEALKLLAEVLADAAATPREKLRACSVAIEMAAQNLVTLEYEALLSNAKLLGRVYQQAASSSPSATAQSSRCPNCC